MVLGPNKPSSNFWNVVILLGGFFAISEVTTCQVRQAVMGNRDVSREILKVEQDQNAFVPASTARHEKTQSMLREVLDRLPATRPSETQP